MPFTLKLDVPQDEITIEVRHIAIRVNSAFSTFCCCLFGGRGRRGSCPETAIRYELEAPRRKATCRREQADAPLDLHHHPGAQ